eukprot:maker-scaffold927_size80360-snap-gene-0.25 protein:Tk12215 transcript:maker-scaffold927_size80360-snap-gene-0.25-mRNA-1 annotation:"gpmi_geosl ame: full"
MWIPRQPPIGNTTQPSANVFDYFDFLLDGILLEFQSSGLILDVIDQVQPILDTSIMTYSNVTKFAGFLRYGWPPNYDCLADFDIIFQLPSFVDWEHLANTTCSVIGLINGELNFNTDVQDPIVEH